MLTSKLKKKGDKLNSMLVNIKKLDKQNVEVGYFGSQGKHTGADGISNYSYAALAQALSLGYFPAEGVRKVPMPFLNKIGELTAKKLPRSTKVNRALKLWAKRIDKRASPQQVLDAIGEFAVSQSKLVFNNPAYFPQAPANKTPLVETGELRSKFTYKTSYDNRVRRT